EQAGAPSAALAAVDAHIAMRRADAHLHREGVRLALAASDLADADRRATTWLAMSDDPAAAHLDLARLWLDAWLPDGAARHLAEAAVRGPLLAERRLLEGQLALLRDDPAAVDAAFAEHTRLSRD